MPFQDNRPTVDRLRRVLGQTPGIETVEDLDLQELLDASVADVELKATTSFNGRVTTEHRDGNGTAQMTLFKSPATSVRDARVETPILGYTRVYEPDEIKLYRRQAIVRIFTYKMLAQTITGQALDHLNWGTIFPPLPQAVHITYTYGFPQYDPDANVTSLDGGVTSAPGDLREPEERQWLQQLQQAAVCDAAASYLAQTAGQAVGLLSSVSFDGYSESSNPQAYGAQVQALVEKRDELLARRKRMFFATTGL